MIIHIILLSLGYSVSVTLCCLCKKSLCVSVSFVSLFYGFSAPPSLVSQLQVTLMRVELLKVLKVVNDCFQLSQLFSSVSIHWCTWSPPYCLSLSLFSLCMFTHVFIFVVINSLRFVDFSSYFCH